MTTARTNRTYYVTGMAVVYCLSLASLCLTACSHSRTHSDAVIQDASPDPVDSAPSPVADSARDGTTDIAEQYSLVDARHMESLQTPDLLMDCDSEEMAAADLVAEIALADSWEITADIPETSTLDLAELLPTPDGGNAQDTMVQPWADIYSTDCSTAFEDGEDVIFVLTDSDPAGPPDGSPDAPFTSLKAALSSAAPGTLVCVGPGTYYGPLAISQPGLILQGAGAEVTLVESEPLSPGITVTASQVTVRGIGISNGTSGVHFAGTQEQLLSDCSVMQVAVKYLATGSQPPESVTGILVEYCQQVQILDSLVSGLKSGDGQHGGFTYLKPDAKAATGIHLVGSSDCLVSGNRVEQIEGGEGGALYFDYQDDGGQGGDAAGIFLSQTNFCEVTGNLVQNIYGGGSGGASGTSCDIEDQERGGNSWGISLVDAQDVQVSNNAVLLVHGNHDHRGDSLAAGIDVRQSSGVNLTDNVVEDILGATGKCHWHGNPNPNIFVPFGYTECSAGGLGAGIHVADSSQMTMKGNDMRDIMGGTGGDQALFSDSHDKNGDGGSASGLSLSNVNGGTVMNNVVNNISGGDGGDPEGDQAYGGHCGNGGSGAGLALGNLTDITLAHFTIHDVSGGHGGTSVQSSTVCENGPTTAVQLGDGPSISFGNSIISDIAGGRCLGNDSPVPKAQLEALWSNLRDCISPNGQTTLATDCLDVAPGYVDEPLDLHLLPDSPCIDSADPDAAFGAEPAPNGCRANMGAYGNTLSASADPDAAHCPQQ